MGRRDVLKDAVTPPEMIERLFHKLSGILSEQKPRVSSGKEILDLFSKLPFVDAVIVHLEGSFSRNSRTFVSGVFPAATPSERKTLSEFLENMGPLPVVVKSPESSEGLPPPVSEFCRSHGFGQALFVPLFAPGNSEGKKGAVALFVRGEKSGDPSFESLGLKAFSLLSFPLPTLPSDLDNLVRFYKALHEINHLIARHPDPDFLYAEVCRIAVTYAGLRLAWVATVDRKEGTSRLLSVYGPARAYADGLFFTIDANSPFGRGPAGRAIREGRIIVTEIDSDPDFEVWRKKAHRFGLHASASFPFRRNGRIEGLMGVYSEDPHYFAPPLVALLNRLSEDMEFALESFDRSARIERLQTHLRSLLEITEEIAKRPDEKTLLEHVTSLAVEKVGVANAIIILRKENGVLALAAQEGPLLLFPERIRSGYRGPSDHSPESFGIINRVLSTGRTVVVDSFAWSPAFIPWRSLLREQGIESGAGFPLVVEGQVIGLLLVGSREGDFFTEEIVGLLENMVENISFAISDIRRKRRLEFLGLHDDLTGLPNRTSFLEILESTLSRRAPFFVAILDIDNFKEINDSMGHAAGDRVLVEASSRISVLLRPGEILARLGGDEFALLLSGRQNPAEVESFWEELSRALDRPVLIDAFETGILSLTTSMGVASALSGSPSSGDLLKEADQALYFSKESGRNTWTLYTPSLNERAEKTFGIRRAFRTGLEKGEMFLYLQPQVDLGTGAVRGAEALVRWKDPRTGEIRLPGTFLPVVESDLSQVTLLGEWVLEEAYRLLSMPGMEMEHLSINIGALHFLHKNFLSHVDAFHLSQPEIGSRLTIEITEAVALSHLDLSARTIKALSERGISVALDDFGTGFGSLSYLNSLPLGEIKIDQSFIRNMSYRTGDFAIVSGTLLTASLREIRVVAEGLEKNETGLALLRIGCHYAQGFGIARPMPIQEFSSWKASWRAPDLWKKGRPSYFLYRGVDLLLAHVELRGFMQEASLHSERISPGDLPHKKLVLSLRRLREWLDNGLRRFGGFQAYRKLVSLLGIMEDAVGSGTLRPSDPEISEVLSQMDAHFSDLVDAVEKEGR